MVKAAPILELLVVVRAFTMLFLTRLLMKSIHFSSPTIVSNYRQNRFR